MIFIAWIELMWTIKGNILYIKRAIFYMDYNNVSVDIINVTMNNIFIDFEVIFILFGLNDIGFTFASCYSV